MRRRSVTRVALAFRSAPVAWSRGTATAPESRPRPWASGGSMHAERQEHWSLDPDCPDSGFEHVVMEATPDPGGAPPHPVDRCRPGPAGHRCRRHGAVMDPTRSMEPPVPGRPGRLPHGRAGHPDRDLGPAPDHRDAGTAQPARPGATGPPDRRLRQRAQAFFAAVRPRQEFQASKARILAAHDLAGHAAG